MPNALPDLAERISESIAKFMGNLAFLLLQILLVLVWSAINLKLVPGVNPSIRFTSASWHWSSNPKASSSRSSFESAKIV